MSRVFLSPASAAVTCLLALLLLCATSTSATSASASAATATAFAVPAWTHNKTEWRTRLYNSLRLTPWQVRLLEGALDARDAIKAPLTLAADAVALAVANATYAAKRQRVNSTFQRVFVAPVEKAANETSSKIEKARVSALNKTEIALRAGAASIYSSSSSSPPFLHPLAASAPALLLAGKLNVSANAVAKRISTLTTIEQYRAAAAAAKAGASGLPPPFPAIVFGAAPEQIGTSTAAASRAELVPSSAEGAVQLDWTPMGPDSDKGASPSSSPSSPSSPIPSPLPPLPQDHPSWLVYGGDDAEIAEWVAARPESFEAGADLNEKERTLRLAEWLEAAPGPLLDDILEESKSASEAADEGGEFVTISPEVRCLFLV